MPLPISPMSADGAEQDEVTETRHAGHSGRGIHVDTGPLAPQPMTET